MTTRCRGVQVLAMSVLLLVLWSLCGPAPARADLFGREPDSDTTAAPETTTETPEAAPGFAADELMATLPRQWHGTFAWDNGVAYFVEAEIVSLSARPNGEISFIADTLWMPDNLQARMNGRIDPASLQVRIWEVAADESAENFESDGRYDGQLSIDLWDLRAQWITDGSGETGTLVLVAESPPGTAN